MSAMTIEARDIKPGDHISVLDVDVLWVSHIEEFYVNLGWTDKRVGIRGLVPVRISKFQHVTVVRKVKR